MTMVLQGLHLSLMKRQGLEVRAIRRGWKVRVLAIFSLGRALSRGQSSRFIQGSQIGSLESLFAKHKRSSRVSVWRSAWHLERSSLTNLSDLARPLITLSMSGGLRLAVNDLTSRRGALTSKSVLALDLDECQEVFFTYAFSVESAVFDGLGVQNKPKGGRHGISTLARPRRGQAPRR